MGKVKCTQCNDVMYKCNIPRHMLRLHKVDVEDPLTMVSSASSIASSQDPSPAGQKRNGSVMDTQMETELLEIQIEKAVACMLRCERRNDLDTLRNYLARQFPLTRPELRDAIIFATFKTAQRVATAHADAILKETDCRVEWARKSLARWLSGLSVIEPAADYAVSDPRTEAGKLVKSSSEENLPACNDDPLPVQPKSQEEKNREEFDCTTAAIVATAKQYVETGVISSVVDNRLEQVAAKLSEKQSSMPVVMDSTVEPVDPVIPVLHIPNSQPVTKEQGELVEIVVDFPPDLSFNDLLSMRDNGIVVCEDVDLYKPLIELDTPEISPLKGSQTVPSCHVGRSESPLPPLTSTEPVTTHVCAS